MKKKLRTTDILIGLAVGSFIVLLIATFKLQSYPLILASWCGVLVSTGWGLISFMKGE